MPRREMPENDRKPDVPLLDDWLHRLNELAAWIKGWAEELDWSTRVVSKKMNEPRLGRYEAPALIVQKETTRVLLDPVARFAPGTEGIVDLYLMPGYDDIATLYFTDGEWRLHHLLSRGNGEIPSGLEGSPLTKETLAQLFDEMTAHAPEPL